MFKILKKNKLLICVVFLTAGQPTSGAGLIIDKAKEWQMELLMEKLRSKASSLKPLVETAKNMRMAMLVRT